MLNATRTLKVLSAVGGTLAEMNARLVKGGNKPVSRGTMRGLCGNDLVVCVDDTYSLTKAGENYIQVVGRIYMKKLRFRPRFVAPKPQTTVPSALAGKIINFADMLAAINAR